MEKINQISFLSSMLTCCLAALVPLYISCSFRPPETSRRCSACTSAMRASLASGCVRRFHLKALSLACDQPRKLPPLQFAEYYACRASTRRQREQSDCHGIFPVRAEHGLPGHLIHVVRACQWVLEPKQSDSTHPSLHWYAM